MPTLEETTLPAIADTECDAENVTENMYRSAFAGPELAVILKADQRYARTPVILPATRRDPLNPRNLDRKAGLRPPNSPNSANSLMPRSLLAASAHGSWPRDPAAERFINRAQGAHGSPCETGSFVKVRDALLTHITIVLSQVRMLAIDDGLSIEQREHLSEIERAGRQMQGLIALSERPSDGNAPATLALSDSPSAMPVTQ